MKEYKKLKKFMFTMQSKMDKDPKIRITTDFIKDLLEEIKVDIETLGGFDELKKLLKIHPKFVELNLTGSDPKIAVAEKYKLAHTK